jgi:hypothetical protein
MWALTSERLSRISHWAPHLLVGLIALPFILHQNSEFEWSNALWLLDVQTAHVRAHGMPTYFVDAPEQYFYPQNLFYAGPVFSVLAYPSLVFGTWPVFAFVTAATFVASSAGISWTARNLGVPPTLAIIPGVLYALAPDAVSALYGQAVWTEMVAMSAVAVALGAATSLTTGRAKATSGAVVALALAVAVLSGAHNITLFFTALLAPLLALTLLPLLRGSKRELLRRHMTALVGIAVGLAVCGAFLIPDIWLAGRTIAGSGGARWLHSLLKFDTFDAVFNPTLSKAAGAGSVELRTQTLVVPMVWCGVALVYLVVRKSLDRRSGITLALLATLGVGITLLVTHPGWWLGFPAAFQAIQFPFRLVGYLSLLIALSLCVLLANPAIRRSRVAYVTLLLVVAWQVGLAVDFAVTAKESGQVENPLPVTVGEITATKLPPAYRTGDYQGEMYRFSTSEPLARPESQATVEPIGYDTPPQITLTGQQPPGSLVTTTVVASPLIRLSGEATVAGETSEGYEVLSIDRGAARPWHATVAAVCSVCLGALTGHAPAALLAGGLATVIGVLVLLGTAVGAAHVAVIARRTHARR